MKNNIELIKKLTDDINKLQNKIEYRKLYNVRNFLIMSLLKSGIALDYALPFIISGIIIANSQATSGNAPFSLDEVIEKANIETIDTSSGIHLERVSYDFNYEKELIEHSTGWIINDNGLYERTVTSYILNDKINLNETEKIFSMSKEELEQLLTITNIRTIKKNNLEPDDSIYNSDAIIVINNLKSEEKTRIRKETESECFFHSLGYIIFVTGLGSAFKSIEKLFIKTCIRDRLKNYASLFKQIKRKDLEMMRKNLKLKQENLDMLNIESNSIKNQEGHSYKLRRK